MVQQLDQYWSDVVAHLDGLDIADGSVVAPREFGPHVALAGTYDDLPSIDVVEAFVLHKGQLDRISPSFLAQALDALEITFANQVFIVLARASGSLSLGSKHLSDWDAVLQRARQVEGQVPQLHRKRDARMPATYLGEGRVLLESIFGHLMLVSGADTSIVPHLIRDGWFDDDLTSLLNVTLRPEMTFIDIGANCGTYTLIAAAIVGEKGHVVAIEPAQRIAKLLAETIAMNGFDSRCEVLAEAVGATTGQTQIFEFATLQGGNTMLPAIAELTRTKIGETITQQEVRCRRLDDIVSDLGLERVDFIKIDVEGFETQVLEGARHVISAKRPTLLLEWHSSFFTEGGVDPEALYDLLTRDLGYSLRRVEPHGQLRTIDLDGLMAIDHSDILATPPASDA